MHTHTHTHRCHFAIRGRGSTKEEDQKPPHLVEELHVLVEYEGPLAMRDTTLHNAEMLIRAILTYVTLSVWGWVGGGEIQRRDARLCYSCVCIVRVCMRAHTHKHTHTHTHTHTHVPARREIRSQGSTPSARHKFSKVSKWNLDRACT
jgi:hypothetical protein